MDSPRAHWPKLSYAAWKETGTALHLWSQVVGKYRLAHSPWINHSWHATLYVTPRGLTTGPVPDGPGAVTLDFDFQGHALRAESSDGRTAAFALEPMSVADFLARTQRAIAAVGGDPAIHHSPNELPEVVPFAEDRSARPYDAEAVRRFHRALVAIERVYQRFRTGFLGKCSPVHLFWGAFDLAVTRFSGRPGPRHPGGFPNLPDAITREAYSHEVSSTGFWPGGGGVEEAMFYAYAYPAPAGFGDAAVAPAEAFFDTRLGEFLLPYEAVRRSADPDAALLAFLQSTYVAAADLAGWDRAALECPLGAPRVPRPVE